MSNHKAPLARLQAFAEQAKTAHARVVVTRPVAASEDEDGATAAAELWLYGTVGGYWWGFDSDDVAAELRKMGEVAHITVRLHSFGGSSIEGIAIANLLANHPARKTIVVDGMAASAATQIALAGDELVMSPGSQFFVHDVWMYVAGDAAALRAEADWLDKQSANYAETYAHRAGGTSTEWRDRMRADNGEGTWYSAAEAVEAGIADRVANVASTTTPPPIPSLDDLEDDELAGAAAAYDLDVLIAPAARAAMATWRPGASQIPERSPRAGSPEKEGSDMSFTNDVRARLGVAEDADEATVLAALDEALDERAEPQANTTTTTEVPEGMTLVDTETLAALRAGAEAGRAAREQQLASHRDQTLAAAVAAGKFPPARLEHYAAAWDADPSGTEQLVASLAPGLVPVAEVGHDQPPTADTTATSDLGGFAAAMGLTEEDLR